MAKFSTSKTLGSSTAWLDKAGKFHLRVLKADENPTDKNKMPLDGFKVTFSVLGGQCDDGGDVRAEVGKQVDVMFYNPNPTEDADWQEASQRKQTAYLLAAGLMHEREMGNDVNAELVHSENRQVVAEFEFSKPKTATDKAYLRLRYDRVFHIDDPRGSAIPRDQAALKIIPAAFRRDPNGFDLEKITGKASSASSSAGGSTNGQSRSMAGAGVGGGVDVDDV